MFLWLVLIFCCCTFLRIGAASCDDNDIGKQFMRLLICIS